MKMGFLKPALFALLFLALAFAFGCTLAPDSVFSLSPEQKCSQNLDCEETCLANPDFAFCPGFCSKNPQSNACRESCKNPLSTPCSIYCSKNQGDSICGTACPLDPLSFSCSSYCEANPMDSVCAASCQNPSSFACSKYCEADPESAVCADTCIDSKENYSCLLYCQKKILDPKCGCPKGFEEKGKNCEKIPTCLDGTEYGKCSPAKPLFCSDGKLSSKASVCGCQKNEQISGDSCVVPGKISRDYNFTLNGIPGIVSFESAASLNNLLSQIPRYYYCDPDCPTMREIELSFVDQPDQMIELKRLAGLIKLKSSDNNDRARIAMSLVQNIPYDFDALLADTNYERYPYEVLYDYKGICGEKSKLLSFLLRELGFGVALLNYPKENHQSVGIKCKTEYSVNNSGYCFVESTTPAIPTDSSGEYLGAGMLSSGPEIIMVSEGAEFDAGQAYSDAKAYRNLLAKKTVSEAEYRQWLEIAKRYGIISRDSS